jgi:putative transcriptional regulator
MKNRIEQNRKELGIRQDEFAKIMGVSRQTISSLETGRYNPSIFLAYKIAKYFDMTIEEVFIFDEEEMK